eukprot:TRINITY_DN31572_c0_g1_i2.p1 TRINITY_DN31572_c0_g1~~TRINITY_DN31572_c0_g1_i2.p1  ORF type:complete len:119 (-),score=2.92 TRINITY_DN31572_c0_g1_i2:212-568(-)
MGWHASKAETWLMSEARKCLSLSEFCEHLYTLLHIVTPATYAICRCFPLKCHWHSLVLVEHAYLAFCTCWHGQHTSQVSLFEHKLPLVLLVARLFFLLGRHGFSIAYMVVSKGFKHQT